jgi:hypothetical protein
MNKPKPAPPKKEEKKEEKKEGAEPTANGGEAPVRGRCIACMIIMQHFVVGGGMYGDSLACVGVLLCRRTHPRPRREATTPHPWTRHRRVTHTHQRFGYL